MSPKRINISFPWELPNKLSGPAVIFDVVASSHNIAYLVNKVDELYVVTKETVHFALKEIPEALLIGESDDPQLKDKFFASNSASSITQADLKDKKVILITNNGTHTLNEIWDKGARPSVVGGYANLHTVINWLLSHANITESITLVPSGGRESVFANNPNLLEDLLCAKAAKDLLQGRTPDLEDYFAASREFINRCYPQNWSTKERDLALIFASFDLYPVVPICEKLSNGLMHLYDKK